ncbi:hypothetical protein KKA15_02905 [Patescibacteria group bacterium]|nr:hypothetical protein [Patescibacteria group bacterium]
MSIQFSQILTRGDKIKILVLLIVASCAWFFVWREYKKPIDINWQDAQVQHIER